ncbi:D-sedoheptulose-7-phosphate isomerase [Galenea microaerophila]
MSSQAVELDITRAVKAHQQALSVVNTQAKAIHQAAQMVVDCLQQGGKVLWCGNGGSAADAQHMAAELMVRYQADRRPLASIALTTDTSILTAHPNDYDFESVFARQVEGLAQADDLLIGMTTSGKSANVIQAMRAAKAKGCATLALAGEAITELDEICDLVIHVPSQETARIQEAHNFINHLLCEGLDQVFAP